MINIERFAPNRAYFNLELEALDGNEERITEIKFDGNRLRCYGGWAVEDSTTVAPTVRERTWLKLDAVLEDGPPPRLLLRVDGQLLYAMPTWHKKGDEAKNCLWVSELLPTRCDVHGDDRASARRAPEGAERVASVAAAPREARRGAGLGRIVRRASLGRGQRRGGSRRRATLGRGAGVGPRARRPRRGASRRGGRACGAAVDRHGGRHVRRRADDDPLH